MNILSPEVEEHQVKLLSHFFPLPLPHIYTSNVALRKRKRNGMKFPPKPRKHVTNNAHSQL